MSSIFGPVRTFFVMAIQLLLLRSVSSLNLTNEYLHHQCIDSQGKYKTGSPYEENFNHVFRFTNDSLLRDGFSDTSVGIAPNTAFNQIQCRGDSYSSKCHSCLATANSQLRKRCPENKGAMIWYDQCLFKISSIGFNEKKDYKNSFYMSNPNKVSGNPQLFNKETSAFLDNLARKATSTDNVDGVIMVLYAAGEKMIGTNKVYAMVQCTKKLVFNTCYKCLTEIFKKYPKCCDGKRGGRVLSPNCNFRYELYPFLRT